MSKTFDADMPVSLVTLFNQGSDRDFFVEKGHVTRAEMVEKYPYFMGWEYSKDRYDSAEDYVNQLGGVTVEHTTLGEMLDD